MSCVGLAGIILEKELQDELQRRISTLLPVLIYAFLATNMSWVEYLQLFNGTAGDILFCILILRKIELASIRSFLTQVDRLEFLKRL